MMAPIAPAANGKAAIQGLLSIREMSFEGPQKRVEDKGKYLTIWKNHGNSWKVAQDIFNSDVPESGGPVNGDLPLTFGK